MVKSHQRPRSLWGYLKVPFSGPPCFFSTKPNKLHLNVRLFADYSFVYNTAKNHQSLQDVLAKLEMWEDAWNVDFHPSKCQQITFSGKHLPANQSLYLHNSMIPKAGKIKYLRVTLDHMKTNWNVHVNDTAVRGNSIIGFIRRNILTTSVEVKATAYKQLVCPMLEYASAAWDSASDTAAKLLEAVQRRGARLVCGIRRTNRLAAKAQPATIITASLRETSPDFQSVPPPNKTHPEQYSIPQSNSVHHQHLFFLRTVKDWNELLDSSSLLCPPSA